MRNHLRFGILPNEYFIRLPIALQEQNLFD